MVKLNEYNSVMIKNGWELVSQTPSNITIKYEKPYNHHSYMVNLFYNDCYFFHYRDGVVVEAKHYNIGKYPRINPEIMELREQIREVEQHGTLQSRYIRTAPGVRTAEKSSPAAADETYQKISD